MVGKDKESRDLGRKSKNPCSLYSVEELIKTCVQPLNVEGRADECVITHLANPTINPKKKKNCTEGHELQSRKASVASGSGISRSADEGCAQQVLLPSSSSI